MGPLFLKNICGQQRKSQQIDFKMVQILMRVGESLCAFDLVMRVDESWKTATGLHFVVAGSAK